MKELSAAVGKRRQESWTSTPKVADLRMIPGENQVNVEMYGTDLLGSPRPAIQKPDRSVISPDKREARACPSTAQHVRCESASPVGEAIHAADRMAHRQPWRAGCCSSRAGLVLQ